MIIGWDIGGAHLKGVALDDSGCILATSQVPCPLWQGMHRLEEAFAQATQELPPLRGVLHVLTMTGELVDYFPDRISGVMAILDEVRKRFGTTGIRVFAGHEGFLAISGIGPIEADRVASANWLASGFWAATQYREALFMDIGSTTTDLLSISNGRVHHRGYTDSERMRYDELLYSGIVRTPAMILAGKVPLDGYWTSAMAEHFATMADVYRLTGELPEQADQLPAADGGAKTPEGSRRRLARLFGRDMESLPAGAWDALAGFIREQQIRQVQKAASLQLSQGLLSARAPLIGAGVGRFLVQELARRFNRNYVDFNDLYMTRTEPRKFRAADCGPAAAVACLAFRSTAAHEPQN